MKRYLLVYSSYNKVMTVDELDSEFWANIDEVCMECEIIDTLEMKFYRPSGWIGIVN